MAKNKNIQKNPESNELTEFERRFCDIWFRIRNGRLAYKQLKPHVKDTTADTESSKILSYAKVKTYIENKEVEIQLKEQVELSWIIKELKNIVYDINTQDITVFDNEGRPLNKTDHRAKIEAIKTLAKITGLEAPSKMDVTSNGQSIIPEIKINIIQPKQEEE